ncbi:MAG TPA: betaine--homocysteine S-methyltransferase [Anaerolineales bacterium]|nr:betaine--homocysteine S-methyltransferase [Anaerolineales bacterium]
MIETYLRESPYLIVDGAMGTMLFAAGLQHGDPPELWNVDYPQRVAEVHRQYLQAGARILLTNTFGGNRYRLMLHGLESRVHELNLAAAQLLRQVVADSEHKALVAGDIGPSGQVLEPYGELSFEQAQEAFAEQAAALIAGGVDLLWVETMSDLNEVRAAVEGIRQVSKEIPLVTSMTFDTRGRTMMGVTPEQAIQSLASFGAVAAGGNCGNGPEEIIAVVEKMHALAPEAILVAKANAGIPELVGGKAVYRATPEMMADYAIAAYEAGARVIGACCGSTPAHIQAIAEALTERMSV